MLPNNKDNFKHQTMYSLLAYQVSTNSAMEVFTINTTNKFVITTIFENIVSDSYVRAIKPLSYFLSPHTSLNNVDVYLMVNNKVIKKANVPRIQAVAALFSEIESVHNQFVSISKNRMMSLNDFKRLTHTYHDTRYFKVEPYHLILYQNLRIKWNNLLTDKPIIDKKIPYKTTDIAKDIAELLNFHFLNSCESSEDCLTDQQRETAMAIHHEMATVVEIINSSTQFEEGLYEYDDAINKWIKLSDTLVS